MVIRFALMPDSQNRDGTLAFYFKKYNIATAAKRNESLSKKGIFSGDLSAGKRKILKKLHSLL